VERDVAGLHNSPAKPCLLTGTGSQFTPVTGGETISADGAVNGALTTLTGPTYTENYAGDVGTGTIIINVPTGFVFDTGGTAPTVALLKVGGGSASTVQGSVTSVTSTQITYTVTAVSGTPPS